MESLPTVRPGRRRSDRPKRIKGAVCLAGWIYFYWPEARVRPDPAALVQSSLDQIDLTARVVQPAVVDGTAGELSAVAHDAPVVGFVVDGIFPAVLEAEEMSEFVHERAGLVVGGAAGMVDPVDRCRRKASEGDDRIIPAEFCTPRAVGAAIGVPHEVMGKEDISEREPHRVHCFGAGWVGDIERAEVRGLDGVVIRRVVGVRGSAGRARAGGQGDISDVTGGGAPGEVEE